MITPSCRSLFLQAPLHPFGQAPVLRFGLLRLGSGRPGAYGDESRIHHARRRMSPREVTIRRCWRIRRCSATFWGGPIAQFQRNKGWSLIYHVYQYVWHSKGHKWGYPPLLDKPVWQFCLAIGQDYGIQNRKRQLASHFSKGKSICVCHTHL